MFITLALLASFGSAAIPVVTAAPNPAAEATISNLGGLVAFDVTRRVAIGMTRDQVVMSMLGQPDDKMCSDLWIYWNFRPRGRPETETYTALLVVFAADRVKLIQLSDEAATKRLLLQVRAQVARAVSHQSRDDRKESQAAFPQRLDPPRH